MCILSMCVIINIEKGEYPKYQTLKEAEILNAHGGSIAWLQDGKINYQKGITAKKVNSIIEKRLKPNKVQTAIIHFRIASVGKINKELCHPFPISSEVKTDLKVEDSKFDLLFHNGTVTSWESMLIESLQKHEGKLPNGELSDSRAIAFLLNRHGTDIIKDANFNKFSILTKKGIVKFGTWVKVDKNECSNDYFIKTDYEAQYLGYWSKTETKNEVKKKTKPKYLTLGEWSLKNQKSETKKSDITKFIKTQQDKKYYKLCKEEFYVTDDEILDNLDNGLSMIEVHDLLDSAYGNKSKWINGDFVPSWERDYDDQVLEDMR